MTASKATPPLLPIAPPGGKGGALQIESRSDLLSIAQGIRQGWQFPETYRSVLPAALLSIVVARGADGKTFLNATRDRVAAARVLALMHGQNQKDDPVAPPPQVHFHSHAHTVEDRRATYLARLDPASDGG